MCRTVFYAIMSKAVTAVRRGRDVNVEVVNSCILQKLQRTERSTSVVVERHIASHIQLLGGGMCAKADVAIRLEIEVIGG